MFCCLAAISCPSITITSKGLDITPSFCTNASAVIHYATDCRFTCRSGYQHHGPGLKTCNQQKTWSPLGNPWCEGGLAAIRNLTYDVVASTDFTKLVIKPLISTKEVRHDKYCLSEMWFKFE